MTIEMTEEQAKEVLLALTAHIGTLSNYIFNSRNETSRAQFEEKRRQVENVATQIQNRL